MYSDAHSAFNEGDEGGDDRGQEEEEEEGGRWMGF